MQKEITKYLDAQIHVGTSNSVDGGVDYTHFVSHIQNSYLTDEKGSLMVKKKSVTIRSSDGNEFLVSESAAVLSISLMKILEEKEDGLIHLSDIASRTLAMVIVYLNTHAEDGLSEDVKWSFDHEFVSGKEFDVLTCFVLAADTLQKTCLFDTVAKKMADIMKNKSVEWARREFRIENDYTPEQEEAIRNENAWAFE
ncbi:hypothetical protein DH2020_023205 [Rehmannia glutinosa]|uniref:SKP1-like protein n=1 Tax=Rehmannia glutinosa TaxID=99300 RepID=A0ABR0W9C2_REHGL